MKSQITEANEPGEVFIFAQVFLQRYKTFSPGAGRFLGFSF